MKNEIADVLNGSNTRGWEKIKVDFGDDFLDIEVPADCEILSMPSMPCLVDSAAEITHALNQPTGSPTLSEIIHSKGKPVEDLTVCITVSDITRPAPYKGENGLLLPLLALIEQTGVKKENIVFVIGNGMHRHSTLEERIYMYGPEVVDHYRIVDHDCEDDEAQKAEGSAVYLRGSTSWFRGRGCRRAIPSLLRACCSRDFRWSPQRNPLWTNPVRPYDIQTEPRHVPAGHKQRLVATTWQPKPATAAISRSRESLSSSAAGSSRINSNGRPSACWAVSVAARIIALASSFCCPRETSFRACFSS